MSTLTSLTSIVSPVPFVGVAPKKWTREEYYRLAGEGYFQGHRVELIAGEIVQMSPQSYPHTFSSDGLAELLRHAFGEGYWVRQQAPLSIPGATEPEPDVSVVTGSRFDYSDHPQTAILLVEVAKSSLGYDTQTKPGVYASATIPEYWVLDLINRQLIVHRKPLADKKNAFGYRYQSVEILEAAASIAPLEKPEQSLKIADMLPPE